MLPHSIASVAVLLLLLPLSGFANEFTIDQENKTFKRNGEMIENIRIKVGDTIRFKNLDPFFHNIFSLSAVKTFDLGTFPKGKSKTVVYSKAGTARVECAIHPQMHLNIIIEE